MEGFLEEEALTLGLQAPGVMTSRNQGYCKHSAQSSISTRGNFIFISKRIHATESPSLTSEYKTCKFWSFLMVLVYIPPTQPTPHRSHGGWPHSKAESHEEGLSMPHVRRPPPQSSTGPAEGGCPQTRRKSHTGQPEVTFHLLPVASRTGSGYEWGTCTLRAPRRSLVVPSWDV